MFPRVNESYTETNKKKKTAIQTGIIQYKRQGGGENPTKEKTSSPSGMAALSSY